MKRFLLMLVLCSAAYASEPGREPHAGNPIVPGYYADHTDDTNQNFYLSFNSPSLLFILQPR